MNKKKNKNSLRIVETLKEMFSEPRINAVILLWFCPTLSLFAKENWTWQGVGIISGILFAFCFLVVRFTLSEVQDED